MSGESDGMGGVYGSSKASGLVRGVGRVKRGVEISHLCSVVSNGQISSGVCSI